MTLMKKLFVTGTLAVTVFTGLAFGLGHSAEPPAAPPPRPAPVKGAVQGPTAPVVGKAFAIAPVTTDLQRRLIRSSGPDSAVVVLMDGTPLFKDPVTLNIEAFDLAGLRKGLKSFPVNKGTSVAHFEVHYAFFTDASRDGANVVNLAIEGTARAVGFVPTSASNTTHNGTFAFENLIGPLKDDSGARDAETAVGDERARAYLVRTPLSRVLTESAGGVVDICPLLDGQADEWIPAEVDTSVRAAIEKLKLAKGERLTFLLNIPKRDLKTHERVVNACQRWAKGAGLEYWQLRY
ncbi:hypothetical protein [Frigoriglobus tundricola]|uniref:Uncharacterized protein n=1 Tax=Frigoriglobus tundricola TaxID=2774151 RepID=A0A6M5YHT1_9BACT|nr:hypothetical protein [Frigoriglobus tundricola]QJW92826.1 hypothetical protein FTUN_0323 [Frigoriglobus tundricola]